MVPGRSERSAACGERGGRGAGATEAAAGQRKPCAAAAAGDSGGTSGCGAVRGGAAAAPPPSLRGSSAGGCASLPSGGFLGSLPLFAGACGGLIGFVLVKKSCPSSPESKRAPAGRRPSRRGRAQVNSMGERQRPGPGSETASKPVIPAGRPLRSARPGCRRRPDPSPARLRSALRGAPGAAAAARRLRPPPAPPRAPPGSPRRGRPGRAGEAPREPRSLRQRPAPSSLRSCAEPPGPAPPAAAPRRGARNPRSRTVPPAPGWRHTSIGRDSYTNIAL